MATPILEAANIDGVIDAELHEISKRRIRRKPAEQSNKCNDLQNTLKRCHAAELFGVSISGGGIRSATFALGILQALAHKKLLQKADYLSTVSGGGYIGSWLQGVLTRPNKTLANLRALDRPACCNALYKPLNPGDPEPPCGPAGASQKPEIPEPAGDDPITFLRSYSNYLSPRHGLSIDTLLIPVIWSRNMILNQAIIIAAFLAVFLVAFWPGTAFQAAISSNTACAHLFLFLAALPGALAVGFMAVNLKRISEQEFSKEARRQGGGTGLEEAGPQADGTAPKPGPQGVGTGLVWTTLVLPIFVAVLLLMLAIFSPDATAYTSLVIGGVLLFLLFAALQAFGGFVQCYREQRKSAPEKEGSDATRPKKSVETTESLVLAVLHVVWMSAACAGFTLLLLHEITLWIRVWSPESAHGSQSAIAWGPPLYVLALMAGIVLQIGLMGRDFPDASREWLARAGTLFWTTAVFWAAYFAIAIFAPHGISAGWDEYGAYLKSAFLAWLGTTAASVVAGKSGKTSGSPPSAQDKKKTSTTLEFIARYGPFVAIAGFLVLIAFAAQALLHCSVCDLANDAYWDAFTTLRDSQAGWALGLTAAAVVVFLVLSSRVNINEFSMHHFYKNRLVRCYLGASAVRRRHPNRFTGFDPKDDLALQSLLCPENEKDNEKKEENCCAPYPILNATANITSGNELATQDRKGLSWIFTPLYSGFAGPRSQKNDKTYMPTAELSGSGGIRLGTAMAISGAAANPNWGSHSSPQTAFLLTLFDVRLGWWVGNPLNQKTFRRTGPKLALAWLIRELFGDLNEESGYLNLSDGGHFENLGLYELIRRRCRYIIALDGEQDAKYRFESLGGAVRKCRADFGIDIVINPRPIALKGDLNGAHCVVGKIYYPELEYPKDYQHREKKPDGKAKPGWLLYIKSSITGDEPADVEEYRREHPDFPQQSTADQFFTEEQFESYRMLGEHACKSALDRYDPIKTPSLTLEQMFERLSARWEVPPQAPDGAFSRHAEAYSNLMSRLADHPELAPIDDQVVEGMTAKQEQKDRLRDLFWLDLIQLAEDIFVDLNFADKQVWEHPTYAGWGRVFAYWARQQGMKDVWTKQRKSFGKAFRYFFDDLTGYDSTQESEGLIP